MSAYELRFPERFEGPPGLVNGGIVAGTLAASWPGRAVEVTLRAAIPLATPLTAERDGEAVELRGAEGVLVRAELRDPPPLHGLERPETPALAAVRAAEGRCRALQTHPFPRCFGCGPARDPDDAIRVLPGPIGDAGAVAAVVRPGRSRRGEGPVPDTALLWSALDCASSFPLLEDPANQRLEPLVLGRLCGSVAEPVDPDEPLVALAWSVALEGRKGTSACVLLAGDREVASARATWISIAGRPAA